MGRDFSRNSTRERLAHIAARLMAQDGIEDYALAKRKAARQAGVADTRQLPDNGEIDAALALYRQLYQPDQPAWLEELRRLSLDIMEEFAEFDPHLTGPVLKGNAGSNASIQLQFFTDDGKSVDHLLLNRGIRFNRESQRLWSGDQVLEAPVIVFEREGVEVRITVLSTRDLRAQLRTSTGGKPIERARRAKVEALLTQG